MRLAYYANSDDKDENCRDGIHTLAQNERGHAYWSLHVSPKKLGRITLNWSSSETGSECILAEDCRRRARAQLWFLPTAN